MQAKAGTANLTQQAEMPILPAAAGDGLAAVGLEYKDKDEDMAFGEDD